MKSKFFLFLRQNCLFALPLLTIALAGCTTTDYSGVMAGPGGQDSNYTNNNAVAHLHVGDTVTVNLDGPPDPIPPHEETIKEDGYITMDEIGQIKAAGRTTGELQKAIHDAYVPGYYKHLTVTVKTGDRVFYVRGEVKQPGRQIYAGQITVTKAITSAGDFTDFANHRNVILIRANGQHFKVNCDDILDGDAPDPPVYPGDQIVVQRRMF